MFVDELEVATVRLHRVSRFIRHQTCDFHTENIILPTTKYVYYNDFELFDRSSSAVFEQIEVNNKNRGRRTGTRDEDCLHYGF